jgi:hypothetical protein
MNESHITYERIWRRVEEPLNLPMFGEVDGRVWWGIMGVILAIAMVYVVWMYIRDIQTIGWGWGAFLGICRCVVYGVLAYVFMLPATQTWEEVKKESRVVFLMDASLSMINTRDDMPSPGRRFEDMPARQDNVINLMKDPNFLKSTFATNPVFAYRFGRFADESFYVFDRDGNVWTREQWEYIHRAHEKTDPMPDKTPLDQMNWNEFLKPTIDEPEGANEEQRRQAERIRRLTGGTNIGDSLLTVLNREINNKVQGIVVFTDGRSTEGSPQAYKDISERAAKAKVPIFVVAVGEDRPPIRIDITDLRAPETARPEDPFKVEVAAQGENLTNTEVTINLDVYKPGDDPTKGAKPFRTETKTEKFKPGQPPHLEVEFEIKPDAYGDETTPEQPKPDDKKPDKKDEKKDDKPPAAEAKKSIELAEGDWTFIARIPRDKQELFPDPEHKSEKVIVKVVRRPLRVLMFASAPTRDYQFIRTMMVREVDKGRAELSIHLQPFDPRLGRVQDVPPNRLLTTFPSTLKDDAEVTEGDERLNNLGSYDLIIAFDPDWTKLDKTTLKHVERWVEGGGGLIIVAGPINTNELAKPGTGPGGDREALKPLLGLYPVELEDARIKDLERHTELPFRLNFPGATDEMEFLKLNEEDPKATYRDAWRDFFDGPSTAGDAPKTINPQEPPLRGFYNYYPVKRAKDKAVVIATFSDPAANLSDGREMPYLVTANAGKGRVVWLGSGETWRLRQYKEAYHERFWTKLARFAGAGNVGKVSQRIEPILGRTFPANSYVPIQAKFFDRDLQPLPQTAKPKITVELPSGVKDIATEYALSPRKGGAWEGWFATRFLVKTPGEYKVTFQSEETKESVTRKILVKESNPELDNTRPDYERMYDIASEADLVLNRVPAIKGDLQNRLVRLKSENVEGAKEGHDKLHLLFELKNADLIPMCMKADVEAHSNRGRVEDRWDLGFRVPFTDFEVSWVLVMVVGLLCIEWLTRKLLRLA